MKVPDIDFYEDMIEADDQHVVITIRGIGEMEPDNPASHIKRVSDSLVRATIVPSARDEELWKAMDSASDQVAQGVRRRPAVRDPQSRRELETVPFAADLQDDANLPLTFRDRQAGRDAHTRAARPPWHYPPRGRRSALRLRSRKDSN